MAEMDSGLQVRLEESNIAESDWTKYASQIQASCTQNGVRPIDFDAYSLGELYKLPDGSRLGSDKYILAVLAASAIVMIREAGMFKKKLEARSVEFAEQGIRFHAEDKPATSSYGSVDLQGYASGGQPVLRLGWGWSGQQQLAEALKERERIMALLPT
jgi:hypothetical protein